ncbi:MAG TPA: patatin-like phospholipase family protein [Azospira sp.]|nr:patatin-like phospholipase family protein [Azospira sp.]
MSKQNRAADHRGGPALNLALQGGGAHGAYSWGVLDCLLADGRYGFDGISGTSAGAMNALVLADGLMKGGPEWARLALEEFWQAIADSVPLDLSMPVQGGEGLALMPATRMMLNWTQYLSPYQLNPLNFNPLRKLLKERVDFDGLRRHSPVRLFLAATNANTGKLRLFRNADLSVEAALASACLPMIHHAVEIDGEPYWDGGYTANPAVFPLFYECDSPEILLVLLAPPTYGEVPTTVEEIRARAMELAFNTSVLREMLLFANVIDFSERLGLEAGGLEKRILHTHFHLIEAEDLLHQFGSETKVAADWPFLQKLHDLGYAAAENWLSAHSGDIGVRNSFDLARRFRL